MYYDNWQLLDVLQPGEPSVTYTCISGQTLERAPVEVEGVSGDIYELTVEEAVARSPEDVAAFDKHFLFKEIK